MIRPPSLRLSRPVAIVATGVPVAFVGVFFVWPLLAIVSRGLAPGGAVDIGGLIDIVTNSVWWRVAWFTTWQAVLSTVATLAVGLPIAGVLARYRVPGQRLVRAAFTVPFVMPTVVVATAFIAVFDAFGDAGRSFRGSVGAIIVAHVFFNVSVVVRTVTDPWSRLDRRVDDAARMLGSGPMRAWWTVTLPRLRAPIAAAATIVMLFSFTSFGVVLLLGSASSTTLEVETYIQTTAFLNLDVAAVLALMQLMVVLGLLSGQRRLSRIVSTSASVRAADQRVPVRGLRSRLMVATAVGGPLAFVAAPLAVLVGRSFRSGGAFSLVHYRNLAVQNDMLLVSPLAALRNSVTIGVVATAVAMVVGSMAAAAMVYGRGRAPRLLDTALMLPLGTSAVTLGFGMLITFDEAPLNLRSSAAIVPIAHALVGVPFVIRLLVPTMRSIDDRLRQTALMLGSPPLTTFLRVDVAMMSRSLVAAGGFAFAVSLGEFGATSFIAQPDRPTLPTAVVRLLARPGAANFGQAMAMATILMVFTIVAVLVIESFRVGEAGDF